MPKKIQRATVIRDIYDANGTIGRWLLNGQELCKTLERPENNNLSDNPKTVQNDSGCIPEGIYLVKKDYSGKFQYFSITNVPNRKAIEIHYANIIDELLGCMALGDRLDTSGVVYKGKKQKYFLTSSKRTCDRIKGMMPEEFELEITSKRTLCSVQN